MNSVCFVVFVYNMIAAYLRWHTQTCAKGYCFHIFSRQRQLQPIQEEKVYVYYLSSYCVERERANDEGDHYWKCVTIDRLWISKRSINRQLLRSLLFYSDEKKKKKKKERERRKKDDFRFSSTNHHHHHHQRQQHLPLSLSLASQ
jgi:hypothetical protein